jgi:hypothetical protein
VRRNDRITAKIFQMIPAGTKLGRYEIHSKIGGMGEVYK